jgi:hypothetical protein
MSTSQEERNTAKLGRVEESEQITDDEDLPELVTDSEDTDLEDNKLPELGTGNEDNKPKPTPRRARPPARPYRELKMRELKLPELPTGKPPLPANQGSDKKPRRRFTQGIVTIREVRKYQFRPISPVDPSAPAAVDHF